MVRAQSQLRGQSGPTTSLWRDLCPRPVPLPWPRARDRPPEASYPGASGASGQCWRSKSCCSLPRSPPRLGPRPPACPAPGRMLEAGTVGLPPGKVRKGCAAAPPGAPARPRGQVQTAPGLGVRPEDRARDAGPAGPGRCPPRHPGPYA